MPQSLFLTFGLYCIYFEVMGDHICLQFLKFMASNDLSQLILFLSTYHFCLCRTPMPNNDDSLHQRFWVGLTIISKCFTSKHFLYSCTQDLGGWEKISSMFFGAVSRDSCSKCSDFQGWCLWNENISWNKTACARRQHVELSLSCLQTCPHLHSDLRPCRAARDRTISRVCPDGALLLIHNLTQEALKNLEGRFLPVGFRLRFVGVPAQPSGLCCYLSGALLQLGWKGVIWEDSWPALILVNF